MRSSNRPIGIDFFSGAGGMSLGFEQAGFDVLAAIELDPIHSATHDFNFPDCKVLCRDIQTVTSDEVRSQSGVGDRDIDVVFGGPPCQGFSTIGKRSLEDERNTLLFHYLRLVLALRPKYFVMENVQGLTLGAHQRFLAEVISEFQSSGYDVRMPYQVLNAANYGIPQSRRRLFLLGCRKGLTLPSYPDVEYAARGGRPSLMDAGLEFGPSVADALSDLPDVNEYEELYESDSAHVKFKNPGGYALISRGIERHRDDFGYQRKFDETLLTSSLRTEHTLDSIERFLETPAGETEPISRFHKLDPEGVCNTIRAGTASNRGAFTSPRPIHPEHGRVITVREAARLHSYPDWFRFHVTKWHGFRQVGNSVPPFLARAVAKKVIQALDVKRSRPKRIIEPGDERLLKMNMSKAASHYGVSSRVIEPRIRQVLNQE